MKIKKIINNEDYKHTWDIEVPVGNEYLLSNGCVSHNTSGKVINATEGVDAPRRFKKIEEGTYSLPFVVPNLRENREYYQLMFSIANKDVIELAAIRQKFLCMGQSVSLAYESLTSSYEHVSNILLAEKLGLKTIYYSYTKKASLDEGEEDEEECEACGS